MRYPCAFFRSRNTQDNRAEPSCSGKTEEKKLDDKVARDGCLPTSSGQRGRHGREKGARALLWMKSGCRSGCWLFLSVEWVEVLSCIGTNYLTGTSQPAVFINTGPAWSPRVLPASGVVQVPLASGSVPIFRLPRLRPPSFSSLLPRQAGRRVRVYHQNLA